jgi:menaquinone-9 beta-reductase
MRKTDVLIVGGGPAGSSCAWVLKKSNISCLILDQHEFPRLKPCGGWLTPEVFQDLQLDIPEYPLGLTQFSSFDIAIRKFKFRLPTRQYAIRRLEFDHWLLQRSGTEIAKHTVQEIVPTQDGYVIDGEYSAKYLVGAGGTHCPVKKTFFTNGSPVEKGTLIVAMEEEFQYAYTDSRCYLWFLENDLPGYSWYVPKSGGYLNVGIGAKAEELKIKHDSLRRHWDVLVEKLSSIELVRDHDFKPSGHSYHLRTRPEVIHKDGVYLVGDSAGLATVDMGEGIGPAIRSGLLAAESIATGKHYSLSSIKKYSFLSILQHGLFG